MIPTVAGYPHFLSGEVSNEEPTEIEFPSLTNYLSIQNQDSTNVLKIFRTKEDATNDVNGYYLYPQNGSGDLRVLKGPFETIRIWLRGGSPTTNTAYGIAAALRR